MKVGIINYGMGNIKSVYNAIDTLGHQAILLDQPEMIDDVERIILPGVGTFSEGMTKLKERKWIEPLSEQVHVKKKPLLGICLGMQLLASSGTECGNCLGLGFIEGVVKKINFKDKELRLPHIGWNTVSFSSKSKLYENLGADQDYYFIHSYVFTPDKLDCISGICNYGIDFVASVEKENIFGTQYHPEKSHKAGLAVLKNFIEYKGDFY